jgi:hypothetical protein
MLLMGYSRRRKIFVAIVVIVVLLFGFAMWKLHSVVPSSPAVDQVELSQLQSDLQSVTPHFIDSTRPDDGSLTTQEQKIKDDVVALLTSQEADNADYYSGLLLRAIGERYVLISQPSADSYYDVLIDSHTGSSTFIPNGASYVPFYLPLQHSQPQSGKQMVLYIGAQDIYTYTLDQSSFVVLPHSTLSGNETYHSGRSDFRLDPDQTHTDNSLTIAVFDGSQIVQNPDAQANAMQTMNKKLRDVTFTLP